jgi:hypothetical protein
VIVCLDYASQNHALAPFLVGGEKTDTLFEMLMLGIGGDLLAHAGLRGTRMSVALSSPNMSGEFVARASFRLSKFWK